MATDGDLQSYISRMLDRRRLMRPGNYSKRIGWARTYPYFDDGSTLESFEQAAVNDCMGAIEEVWELEPEHAGEVGFAQIAASELTAYIDRQLAWSTKDAKGPRFEKLRDHFTGLKEVISSDVQRRLSSGGHQFQVSQSRFVPLGGSAKIWDEPSGEQTLRVVNNAINVTFGKSDWAIPLRFSRTVSGYLRVTTSDAPGIGLSPISQLSQVTVPSLAQVAFQPIQNDVQDGQIVVLESWNKYFLAIQLARHDEEGDYAVRYQILSARGQFDPEAFDLYRVFSEQLDDFGQRLSALERRTELAPGGRGLNNRLPEPSLTAEDIKDLKVTLAALVNVVRSPDDPKSKDTLTASEKSLGRHSKKITAWTLEKLNMLADSAVDELGKAAGDYKMWLATELMLSGQLDQLINTIRLLAHH